MCIRDRSEDENKEITVTIKVEPLESRTYVLPTSQIKQVGASSQYEYEYDRSTINVLIRGLKEDLDQLKMCIRDSGLGVLYSGFFSMAANWSRPLRRLLGLKRKERAVTTLVLGYSAVNYRRTAQKERASVRQL